MLEINDLTIVYGRTPALRGVSLKVHSGEAVGVIGPNGAGKSTLLAAISGLLRPTSGDIEFLGESIAGQAPERITRLGIALVPEGRRIFGSLTVLENLRLGTHIRSDKAVARGDIAAILDRFPVLRRYADVPAGRLSGGEQQQLAIARAVLARPKLLLLDEPSLGLAPALVNQVFRILDELNAANTTILLVEQNAVKTIAFADRTYILRSGAIALSGTRDDLRHRQDIAEAYLG